MKRKLTLIAAVLACALLLGIVGVTWAESNLPTVTFDAANKQFTFDGFDVYSYGDENNDGLEEHYPDLFPRIRKAMPGDSYERTFRVRVINAGNDTVKMYLKAEEPNDDYKGLLTSGDHPVTLSATYGEVGAEKVDIRTKAKDFIKGERDESVTNTDTNVVYLGAFTGSAKDREIEVKFSIPLLAGNEYAGLEATVDWVFVAEVIPYVPPVNPPINPPVNPPDEPDEPGHEDDRGVWHLDLEEYHMAYIIGSDDGLVHPEDPITRAGAVTVFFRLMTDACREYYWSTSNPFYDISAGDWYNNAISTMYNAGIVTGYPDGSFRPDEYISRAEFVTILSRVVTAKRQIEKEFSDVNGEWFESYVDNGVSLGIITGYLDGTFRPDDPILRAEVMVACNRLMGRLPCEESLLEDMIVWEDNMDPNQWYYLDVQEATNSHMHKLGGQQVLYEDNEYWIRIDPYIEWEKLERIDSTATNMYQSNQPTLYDGG